MAYKLSIGYRDFVFASAADAAKVLDLLDRAVMTDAMYDSVTGKSLAYKADHAVHLAKQEDGHVYANYEEAQAVCEANKAKQAAQEAQATTDA